MSRTIRRKNCYIAHESKNYNHNWYNKFWCCKQISWNAKPDEIPYDLSWTKKSYHRDRPRRGTNRLSYKQYIIDNTRNEAKKAMQKMKYDYEFLFDYNSQRKYDRGFGWKNE